MLKHYFQHFLSPLRSSKFPKMNGGREVKRVNGLVPLNFIGPINYEFLLTEFCAFVICEKLPCNPTKLQKEVRLGWISKDVTYKNKKEFGL